MGRRRRGVALKRTIDIVGAAAALVALSPVLVATALLVRLRLGKPVIFPQQRPGRDARPFTLLKFRTMRDAYDDDGRLLPDERRLTQLGRFLRETSLDELPELVNVLRGDMSLVGPRPLLMSYVGRYSAEQARRHEVRPGITGLAQVSGRNVLSWQERFALDVWYVEHRSMWLDTRHPGADRHSGRQPHRDRGRRACHDARVSRRRGSWGRERLSRATMTGPTGEGALIRPLAKIVNGERLELGAFSTIDDFVFLNAGSRTVIGRYVHVASHVSITGGGELVVGDYAVIATGARILTATDTYDGGAVCRRICRTNTARWSGQRSRLPTTCSSARTRSCSRVSRLPRVAWSVRARLPRTISTRGPSMSARRRGRCGHARDRPRRSLRSLAARGHDT